MKYKKYLYFLLLIMIVGINKTYASTNINYSELSKFTTVENTNIVNILEIDCEGLFGDENDPESLRYLINEILVNGRIIVPVLVIGLGTLDFAKAVIAGKEDEMKKAQSTFIKRVIIGVAFFFTPLFIDIIMWLADMVWEGMYSTCGL